MTNRMNRPFWLGVATGLTCLGMAGGIVMMFSGASVAQGTSKQYKGLDNNGKPSGGVIETDLYRSGTSKVPPMYGQGNSSGSQWIVTTLPDGRLNFALHSDGKGRDKGQLSAAFITRPSNVSCIPPVGGLSSTYGYRWHPDHFFWRIHDGQDYGVPINTPITAPFDGRVTLAQHRGEAGNVLTFEGGPYRIQYLHLSDRTASLVPGGTRSVKAGEMMAYSGNTGNGVAHLHMKLEFSAPGSGRFVSVDPARFLCGAAAGSGGASSAGTGNPNSTTASGERPDTGSMTQTGEPSDGQQADDEHFDGELSEMCPLAATTVKPAQPDPATLPPVPNPLIQGVAARPTRQ